MIPEQIVNLHEHITNFLKVKDKPSILVIFVNLALNSHWVTLVAYTPNPTDITMRKLSKLNLGVSLTKLYYMDSTNLIHLNKP